MAMLRPPAAIGIIFQLNNCNLFEKLKEKMSEIVGELDYEDGIYTFNNKDWNIPRLLGEAVGRIANLESGTCDLIKAVKHTGSIIKSEQHSTKNIFIFIDHYNKNEELFIKLHMNNNPLDDYPCQFIFFTFGKCEIEIQQENCKILRIDLEKVTEYIKELYKENCG